MERQLQSGYSPQLSLDGIKGIYEREGFPLPIDGHLVSVITRFPASLNCFLTVRKPKALQFFIGSILKNDFSESVLGQFEQLGEEAHLMPIILRFLPPPNSIYVLHELAKSVIRTQIDLMEEARAVANMVVSTISHEEIIHYLSPELDDLRQDVDGRIFLRSCYTEYSLFQPIGTLLTQAKKYQTLPILNTIRALGIERAKTLYKTYGSSTALLAFSMLNGRLDNFQECFDFCETLAIGEPGSEDLGVVSRAFELWQKNLPGVLEAPKEIARRTSMPSSEDSRLQDIGGRLESSGIVDNMSRYFWFDLKLGDWNFSVLDAVRADWGNVADDRPLGVVVVARWDHNGALSRVGQDIAPLLQGYRLVCMETDDRAAAALSLDAVKSVRGKIQLLAIFAHANPHGMRLGQGNGGLIGSSWFQSIAHTLAEGAVVAIYGCNVHSRGKNELGAESRSIIGRPRIDTQVLKGDRPDLVFFEAAGSVRRIDWQLDAGGRVVGATFS